MPELDFFNRLKERKLVQWTLAYVAAAWVVTQLTEVLATPLRLSVTFQQGVLVVLVIGFFATLILAWYHGEKGRQRVSGPELLILAVLLAIGGAGLSLLGSDASAGDAAREEAAGPVARRVDRDRPAIAVLPFANRSDREEDRYFTDGMHDEILTRLSRIAGLKTISRTSVEEYRHGAKSVPEIGAELGVDYVLEGSVQRAGDRVRIQVQLIDAADEGHVWGSDYTEGLAPENLLDVQSRITASVASELRLVVAEEEERRYVASSTTSPEAYDLFLRANGLFNEGAAWPRWWDAPLRSQSLEEITDLLDRAVTVDPGFARAHALRSRVHSRAYQTGVDRSAERADAARAAAESARSLAPDDPWVRFARALYLYRIERDYPQALEELSPVADVLAGDDLYHAERGRMQERLGEWDAAIRSLSEAVSLNPRSSNAWRELGVVHFRFREWDAAERSFRSALALDPSDEYSSGALVEVRLERDGDVEAYGRWGAESPGRASTRVWAAYLGRDWDATNAELARGESVFLTQTETRYMVRSLWKAFVARASGDEASAQAHARDAVVVLADLAAEQRVDHLLYRALALGYALLGQEAAADEAVARAFEILPLERDALVSSFARRDLVRLHVFLGRYDAALDVLETLLAPGGGQWHALWALDPTYDPLRDHPQFNALLREHGILN